MENWYLKSSLNKNLELKIKQFYCKNNHNNKYLVFILTNDYPRSFEAQQVRNYVKSVNWTPRLNREIPFLVKIFKDHNFTEICDLGCGPGMHAQKISSIESSMQVTGLDIDHNMISFALEITKVQNAKNLNFVEGNFLQPDTLPDLKEKFDVIYTLGNALMIIWSNNETTSLTTIFKALSNFIKPGGGLFFQILNSDAPRKGHVVSKISQNESGENQVLLKHFLAVDDKLYTTFSSMNWQSNDSDIRITDTRSGYLKLVPLEKLKASMEEAGFKKMQFFENYNGAELKPNSSDSLLCFALKN